MCQPYKVWIDSESVYLLIQTRKLGNFPKATANSKNVTPSQGPQERN